MYRPDGLGHDATVALLETYATTHEGRFDVEVMTLGHQTLGSVSLDTLDGEVAGNAKESPHRVLDLSFVDRSGALRRLNPNTPGGGFYRNRMLQVSYAAKVPGFGWLGAEIFTGPMWDFDVEGRRIRTVCHSKEVLAMGAAWDPKALQFDRKTKKTTILKKAMRYAGETRIAIPDLDSRIPEDVDWDHLDPIWPRCANLGRNTGNRRLLYDAAGWLHLRRPPRRPVLSIKGQLTSEVAIGRPDSFFNTFEAWGPKPKGDKKRIHEVAYLRGKASPTRLGRTVGGVVRPHRLVWSEEFDKLDSAKAAREIVEARRDNAERITEDVSFSMAPNWLLEEYDPLQVWTGEGWATTRMHEWTWSIGSDSPMQVGAVDRDRLAA